MSIAKLITAATAIIHAEDDQPVWDFSELAGKKMDWEEACKFLQSDEHLENNVPNKTIFSVKKGIKFNRAKLIKILNAMDPSIRAYAWPGDTRKFCVDFNFDHPVAGKVVWSPSGYSKENEAKYMDTLKKLRQESNDLSKSHTGGWFLDKGASSGGCNMTVLGIFEEGPFKGRAFAVSSPYPAPAVGSTIKVTHEPTYGTVRIAK